MQYAPLDHSPQKAHAHIELGSIQLLSCLTRGIGISNLTIVICELLLTGPMDWLTRADLVTILLARQVILAWWRTLLA